MCNNLTVMGIENYMREVLENKERKIPREIEKEVITFKDRIIAEIKKEPSSRKCIGLKKISILIVETAKISCICKEISETQINSFKKIFKIVDEIFSEITYWEKYDTNMKEKIETLIELAKVSAIRLETYDRKYLTLFSDIEDVREIMKRIHLQWSLLKDAGLSKKVIEDFYGSFRYQVKHLKQNRNDENFKIFIGILEGTMKFEPVYQIQAVNFKVVPSDLEKDIFSSIRNVETKYDKGYKLK
mgnify:FL=1